MKSLCSFTGWFILISGFMLLAACIAISGKFGLENDEDALKAIRRIGFELYTAGL